MTKKSITLKVNNAKGWIKLSRYLNKFKKEYNYTSIVWYLENRTYKIDFEKIK